MNEKQTNQDKHLMPAVKYGSGIMIVFAFIQTESFAVNYELLPIPKCSKLVTEVFFSHTSMLFYKKISSSVTDICSSSWIVYDL